MLRPISNGVANFRLRRFAKARQLGNTAGFTGRLQVCDRADFQLLVERFDFFRAQPGNGKQFENGGRKFRAQFIEKLEAAGGSQFADFCGDRFPDSGDLFQRLLILQVGKAGTESFDRARGILIGANFERIFFFEFQQRRDFFERSGNLFLGHHDWQNGNFRVKFALRKMVRPPRLLALLATLFLALSFSSMEAVILYRTGDPSANTTEPGSLPPHEGWDYEGTWGGFLGTPIAPHFFISAKHIGQAGGTTFTFQNVNYSVLRGLYDPQSDLVIWQIAETFPTFASLYPRQDEVGQITVDIGRGTPRGTAYSFNNQMLGWLWADGDGRERWGE